MIFITIYRILLVSKDTKEGRGDGGKTTPVPLVFPMLQAHEKRLERHPEQGGGLISSKLASFSVSPKMYKTMLIVESK